MRILVPGKTGQVGWELQSALAPLGTVIPLDRRQMDLSNPDSIRRAIRDSKPGIIVNAAGLSTVDVAEAEFELAMRVNGNAPGIMAEEAKRVGAILIHYSTDYVFDGKFDRPYTEQDATNPVNNYGLSKRAGERAIEAVGGKYLILRASWVYANRGSNFVLTILRLAREKAELSVVNDQTGSPTWARRLAQATAELLYHNEIADPRNHGIYHLSADGATSRYEFAKAIIQVMSEITGVTDGWARVKPITSDQYPLIAKRPLHPVTSKDRIKRAFGIEMPSWESQLRSFLSELAAPKPS